MLPIIRVGNIAAFPDEPIQLRTGAERVVLVETRSIAGLSGSPVFVHFGDHRRSRDGKLWEMPDIPAGYIAGQNWLLGIMHGVYTSEGNDPDGIGDATGEPLNTGIGVVIPVERIHEILDHPTLKERPFRMNGTKNATREHGFESTLAASILRRTRASSSRYSGDCQFAIGQPDDVGPARQPVAIEQLVDLTTGVPLPAPERS